MPTSISLLFGDAVRELPLRETITQSLIRKTEPLLVELRKHGANTALIKAITETPGVISLITHTGDANSDWMTETGQRIADEYKENTGQEMPKERLVEMLRQRLLNALAESYPDVLKSLMNPQTAIDLTDEKQTAVCTKIVEALIDDRQMTTPDKEFMAKPEFWEEQDIAAIARVVQSFRERLQQ